MLAVFQVLAPFGVVAGHVRKMKAFSKNSDGGERDTLVKVVGR